MSKRRGIRWNCTATAAFAVGCALFLVASGLTQENPASNAAPPAQAPSSNQQPGFVDAVGRWFEEGAAKFKSQMEDAQEKFGQFGSQAREATKEATGAIVGLPNARVVNARERCLKAPNGAPDCLTAAVTLCAAKVSRPARASILRANKSAPRRASYSRAARQPARSVRPRFLSRARCASRLASRLGRALNNNHRR
jgi:hypothetical protein